MHSVLPLFLALAMIVALAKAAGYASVRLGQPAVLGELLIGLVLGPTVLNMLHWPVFAGADLDSLRALEVQSDPHNRTLFSVVEDQTTLDAIIEASIQIVGDFDRPDTGLLFVVPVSQMLGVSGER